MFLAGLDVPDRLVLKLAHLIDDDELEGKLRKSVARDVRLLALEQDERETIIVALEQPPVGLEDLRAVLVNEREAWPDAGGL